MPPPDNDSARRSMFEFNTRRFTKKLAPRVEHSPSTGHPAVTPYGRKTTSTGSTKASSTDSPHTSINYGPTTTALSGSPAETLGAGLPSKSPSHAISNGSMKVILPVTIIGGVFIVALLMYALWRRRKGATASEIAFFRPHSGTTVMSPSGDGDGTFGPLPIYRENRYSVKSSKVGSNLNLNQTTNPASEIPPGVAERFHRQNPWVQNMWKTSYPPTPPRKAHPLAQSTVVAEASEPKRSHARMESMNSTQTGLTGLSRANLEKARLAVSVTPLAVEAKPLPQPARSPVKAAVENRWSWTNSQPPPSPRAQTISRRSSITSLARFRTVRSWVKFQAERQSKHMTELGEAGPSSLTQPTRALVKKASIPKFAPQPTRKLSEKSLRNDTHGQANDAESPEQPSLPTCVDCGYPLCTSTNGLPSCSC